MLKRGKRSKFGFIVFFSLVFVSQAQAQQSLFQDTYIIPEICMDRAHEIGIFTNSSKEMDVTLQKLKTENAKYQSFNFSAIYNAYKQTLERINAQLEDYKSPLFKFLQNCRKNERNCHGYFRVEEKKSSKEKINAWQNPLDQFLHPNGTNNSKNPFMDLDELQFDKETWGTIPKNDQEFYSDIYCDRVIYRTTLQLVLEEKENQFYNCVNQPFDQVEVELLDDLDPNSYSKQCFYQTNIDGKVYLKNKSEKFLQQIEQIVPWADKFANISLTMIKKSLIPEGIYFILKKVMEEFHDFSIKTSKITDLNHFYNTLDLAIEFASCCQGSNLNLQEFQLSASYLNESALSLFQNNTKPETIQFQTQNIISDLIFDKAESQDWADKIQNQSPLAWSEKQQSDYASFLASNPFFFKDKKTSFSNFISNAKKNPKSVTPLQYGTKEYEQALREYQEELGYSPMKPFYDYDNGQPPYPVPGVEPGATYGQREFNMLELSTRVNKTYSPEVPDAWSQNIMFNPKFSIDFQSDRESKTETWKEKKFNEEKKTYYPRIFKSLIKYQFARVTQAKVIREIQKRTEANARFYLLKDIETFHNWVDSITCKEFTNSYCKLENDIFRKKKHAELYEKIIGGQIDLEYAQNPDLNMREHIFEKNFIDEKLNPKIKEINKYCWTVADPKKLAENQQKYMDEHGPELQALMDTFYAIPRLNQLFGQTEFAETMRFSPETYREDCFTKGVVFGPPAYSEITERLTTPIQTGYATITVMPDGYKDLPKMPIQEKYVPSDFQIRAKDLADMEDDIEEKITDEFQTLKDAYFYNDMKNYKDFLDESASTRVFAMIDYAIDNPSQEVGKYICKLIIEEDSNEHRREKRRQYWTKAAFYAAGAATAGVFLVPVGGAIILWEAGIAITITTTSIIAASGIIRHNNQKNDAVDIAVLTENIKPMDALNLHNEYIKGSNEAQTTILIDVGLLVLLSGKPLVKASKYIKNLMDEQYQLVKLRRLREIKDLARDSSGKVKFQYAQAVEDFLVDYKKVTEEGFQEFKNTLQIGREETDDFLMANWAKDLKKYVQPDPSLLSEIWSQIVYSVKNAPIVKNTKAYFQDLVDVSYNQTRNLRLKELDELSTKFGYRSEIKEFIVDNRKVDDAAFKNFKDALSVGKNQSDEFLLQNYTDDVGRYITETQPLIAKAWSQIVYSTAQSNLVRAPLQWLTKNSIYYKPRLRIGFVNFLSKTLSPFRNKDWYKLYPYKLLSRETSVVNTIRKAKEMEKKTGLQLFTDDEVKNLTSEMKFYRLDKNGLIYRKTDKIMERVFDKFIERNVPKATEEVRKYLDEMIGGELLDDEWIDVLQTFNGKITSIQDCKSLLKVIKFSKKEYDLIDELKNFRELANVRELGGTYIYPQRTKEIIKHINEFYDIAQYTRFKSEMRIVDEFGTYLRTKGFDAKKIEVEIQKIDSDFAFSRKVSDYTDAEKFAQQFEINQSQFFEPISSWKDPLKYQKQFLNQEKTYNNFFHKKLQGYLKKTTNPVYSYEKALVKTQLRKKTEYDCSLPNSIERKNANRLYRNVARYIALGTSFMGYYSNHVNEEMTPEWWGRMGYEMGISYFGSNLQSRFFVQKDGGPLYKSSRDMLSGWAVNVFDAAIYGGVNALLWDTDKKYEAEFAKLIYESENVEQTIHDFFGSHPDIEGKILEQFQKIQQVFDQVELKLSKGTMVDDELEDTFLKAGLIDNIFYSDMELKDRELGQDYIYHDLMQSGYLDEDLYKNYTTDQNLDDQLIDLMTEIMYQDLYTAKSGEIHYPFKTFNMDNHDYIDELPFAAKAAIPLISIPAEAINVPLQIQTGNEAIDRIAFYSLYDFGKLPIAYTKNKMVYYLLCNFDGKLPGRTNEYAALALHLFYKAYMDPLKFYIREQATGH